MIIRIYKCFLLLLFFNTTLRINNTFIRTTIDSSNSYYNKVYGRSLVRDGRLENDYQRGTLYPHIIIESEDDNNDNR
jgi:hypothetical protein